MSKLIVVAGATGNLGQRIVRELLKRNVAVRALVRPSTENAKIQALEKAGVEIQQIDWNNANDLAAACDGAACVVSVVAGLEDVIVDLQRNLLDAAVKARVSAFIPSDFCTNYNNLVPGENRNFDLRRTFKTYLDQQPVRASSVFNGAFADILRYKTPILNLKDQSIAYWGDKAEWKLDFTTMDNTAAFTAEVALDDHAPRSLEIASFSVSPNDIAKDVKAVSGRDFVVRSLGSMSDFLQNVKAQRANDPAGENQLYAKWQQAQYVYSMFATHHEKPENDRYKNLSWTSSREFLKTMFN